MKGDFKEVTYGYCKCGCGEKTKISTDSCKKRGRVRGEPMDFIKGHNFKPKYGKDNPLYGVRKFGKDNPMWNGGRTILKGGKTNYFRVYIPNHHRSDCKGYVLEHILVAEKTLGKPLPKGVVIHHIDGNGLNNENNNLVICQNQSYHMLLHKRERELKNGL